MTTLLYVKDEGLYTDDRMVDNNLGNYEIKLKSKIIVSEDKTFAYCYSGTPNFINKIQIEGVLRKFLINNKSCTRLPIKDLPKLGDDFLFDAFIVVTHSGYGWGCSNEYGGTRLDNHNYVALGSGEALVRAAMRFTGNGYSAMAYTLIKDRLSGKTIYHLNLNELKPCDDFIKRG